MADKDKYQQMRDKMFRFARSIIGNREEAEDIVHDVFVRLLNRAPGKDRIENLDSFSLRAVRNACMDRFRRKDQNTDGIIDVPYSQDMDGWDVKRMIEEAMKSLTEKQREIVHLKDIEGYDISEIAVMLDIEEGNVRTTLSRGRQALRMKLTQMMNYGTR